LKLTKIARNEMGSYLCIASNSVPPSVSKRISLNIHCESLINFASSHTSTNSLKIKCGYCNKHCQCLEILHKIHSLFNKPQENKPSPHSIHQISTVHILPQTTNNNSSIFSLHSNSLLKTMTMSSREVIVFLIEFQEDYLTPFQFNSSS
jgi:hypothetical protein